MSMTEQEQTRLLDELQGLLERQNDVARQGRLSELEVLCEKTEQVAEQIARAGTLKLPEFAPWRRRLARLYEELRLTLSDQRDEVVKEMNRIRRGRRTIGVYRDSIQPARK